MGVLGYDPEVWIKSNGNIRDERKDTVTYSKLEMPPAVQGKHRFGHCQKFYEQIHRFLMQREWAHAHLESNASGTTWLELFMLFDLQNVYTHPVSFAFKLIAMQKVGEENTSVFVTFMPLYLQNVMHCFASFVFDFKNVLISRASRDIKFLFRT